MSAAPPIVAADEAGTELTPPAVDGAAFILDAPADVPAVWGDGERVAWAEGEPLLIVGPGGVGKTTIAQQLTLRRLGVGGDELLDMAVSPSAERVLYVAADRPPQTRRSFARMVSEQHRHRLAERLIVWPGPLPFDLAQEPERLAAMAAHYGADTLILDSLKDVALDLSKDETGSRVNLALQTAVAAGVQTCALHHQRKPSEANRKPRTLADVYGSVWITAGAGSVVLIWGEAGDALVEITHLKQPAGDIGPLKVIHDHQLGASEVQEGIDLVRLAGTNGGITASHAARHLYEVTSPHRNQVERARRRLNDLVNRGLLHRKDGTKGGTDGGTPATWHGVSLLEEPL